MALVIKNLAKSTLSIGISNLVTTISVLSGAGSIFPVLGPSDYFYAALQNAFGTIELVKVTARTGDSMTVVRAQGGTAALSWAAGDIFALRMTAETFLDYIQQQIQTARAITSIAGANNITGAIAGITAYVAQAQYSFLAAANNTGPTSINISSLGARNIFSSGSALAAGAIIAGRIYLLIDDGTQLNLINSSSISAAVASQLQYAITTGTSADYIATLATPITSYVDGQAFVFRFNQANLDNATIQISGVNPPLDIKIATSKGARVNTAAGDLIASHVTLGIVVDSGTGLLVEPAVNAVSKIGFIERFATSTAPYGYLACPLVATNISRVTYADLFAVLGTLWGAGDGTTTFGMPWFPADYTDVQANANIATQSVGSILSHNHTPAVSGSFQVIVAGGVQAPAGTGFGSFAGTTNATTSSTGGAANLAAGVRLLFCIRYRD